MCVEHVNMCVEHVYMCVEHVNMCQHVCRTCQHVCRTCLHVCRPILSVPFKSSNQPSKQKLTKIQKEKDTKSDYCFIVKESNTLSTQVWTIPLLYCLNL